jgi:uncharacterized membrane protein YgcG
VPAGEPFDERQVREITRTLRRVSDDTGIQFSVFVGKPSDGKDPGQFAELAHGALFDPRHSVLILVAPEERRVEVVTGTAVRNQLTDRDCGLAALSMSSSFAGGDLVGGIVLGLRMLAERVRPHGRAALR